MTDFAEHTEDYDPNNDPGVRKVTRIPHTERTAPTQSNWLIKGVIRRGAVGVAFGAPGVGKSTVVVDIAAHVASLETWRGRKIKNGCVLYVAAEDPDGANAMICAWELHHECTFSIPIDILKGIFDLREDAVAIIKEALAFGGPCVLIIIDTLAATWPHGETNEDMAAFLAQCRKIAEETGAAVLIVHHPGHQNSDRERGGSALRAGVDFSLRIARGGDAGSITAEKVRGAPDGMAWGFQLETVVFDQDEDDDDITACVALPAQAPSKADRLSPNMKVVLRALCIAIETKANGSMSVTEEYWREVAFRMLPDDDKNKRQTFRRARTSLIDKGYVHYYNGDAALSPDIVIPESLRATVADVEQALH